VVRRRLIVVTLGALVIAVGGWLLLRGQSSESASPAGGVPTCRLASLPPQAADTVRLVQSGGPFPFPRSDGEVFGNYERHLPEQRRGYYHEYTVITPGSRTRSERRIVTGGTPLTNPKQYFYTGDHYGSFCAVADAGPQ
jgi:ribonuclease T1